MTARVRSFSRVIGVGLGTALFGLLAPAPASAFCGFYVTGADAGLYANATMVVLMRDGTRTVLSMQNNYQGPPEAFALVIPVPTVLQQDQVKVLPREVFEKVDTLGAPRLVEYWEADPCSPLSAEDCAGCSSAQPSSANGDFADAGTSSVRVEAQFVVGEYDVVILSADDSSALDGWLRSNAYNIPAGAAPALAPYVASGMKFFVAKVDAARVTFKNGQAVLSPLRFHYDTPDFALPVRLGLLNSQGSQDLIVNIIARSRYELANYPNVTIPTNIRVRNEVRNSFGSFYEAMFSRVLEQHPGAVVTEYAWSADSCDPCPTPPLGPTELATLGADVLPSTADAAAASGGAPAFGPSTAGFTLTRLHARYTKDSLRDDLVFQQAPPIAGGRGIPDKKGVLDQKLEMPSTNGACQFGCGYDNFQGRYVILHPWDRGISCVKPQRGIWGGPEGMDSAPMTRSTKNTALTGTTPVAGDLSALLAESVPSLKVKASQPTSALDSGGGCAVTGTRSRASHAGWLLLAAGVLGATRRRRRPGS
jgi:MYXO-CTERM domain-containing protein